MRTKTLLIAAAALVATIVSSEAQTVYSANVVGYINAVAASTNGGLPGFTLAANQLSTIGANGSNAVNDVLVNGNWISGGTDLGNPNPAQSVLYIWQNPGYANLYYYSSNDLYIANGNSPYGPSGWYDSGFTFSTAKLNPGSGVFIFNPNNVAITNTYTGQVTQGLYTNTVFGVNKFNLVSVPAPLAGQSLDSTNVNFPSYGDDASETYYGWTGSGYLNLNYYSSNYLWNAFNVTPADGYLPGWYDSGGISHSYNATNNDAIWANVGVASFVLYTGPTTNWVCNFNVQ
jgi:hypothetical protein